MNKPAITDAKLRKLERMLYKNAIEGDSRLGLSLLKLYYKDLGRLETKPQEGIGLVILPDVSDYEEI